jgi:predicted RNase H-like HicB family nuclease
MSNRDKVEELSNRPYSTIVRRELTTTDTITYVAYHPELPYCMTHGQTLAEAVHNLSEVRRLFIEDLLESNLPVPSPQPLLGNILHDRPIAIEIAKTELERAVPKSEDLRDLHLELAH